MIENDSTCIYSRIPLLSMALAYLKQGEQQVMENLYSVAQFFPDGRWEYVRRHVTAEEAIEAFKHYTTSVGVQMGFVERVIITDAGDCTNVEWIHGKGITFPTQEDMAEAEKEQE